MAEDRLPPRRAPSIAPINSAKLCRRSCAISFNAVQNASSTLTLVLWPAITIERLITGDFILRFRLRPDQVSAARPGHALRPHQAIKLLGRNIAEPHGFLAQRRAFLVRGLGLSRPCRNRFSA